MGLGMGLRIIGRAFMQPFLSLSLSLSLCLFSIFISLFWLGLYPGYEICRFFSPVRERKMREMREGKDMDMGKANEI